MVLIVGQGPSQLHSCLRALDGQGSGDNLAALCGLTRAELMRRVRTVNLLSEWHGKAGKGDRFLLAPATEAAKTILATWQGYDRLILLGRNVAEAFGLKTLKPLVWHTVKGKPLAVIPHPSGVNRWYNDAKNRKMAQKFLRQIFLEEKNMEGTVDELTKKAELHDTNLAIAVAVLSRSTVTVAKELRIIKDERLYCYIHDPDTNGDSRGCFHEWKDYVRYRLGPMSNTTIYEYLSVGFLTEGSKPMVSADVEELGVKKAAQLARLPEAKRTKKLIKKAKTISVAAVKKTVDGILAADLPEDQRKAKLVPYTIALPAEVVALINDVELGGQFLESVRDNDRTWTLRAKLWHAVWWHFLDTHREELKEAEKYREDYLAKNQNPPQVHSQSVH